MSEDTMKIPPQRIEKYQEVIARRTKQVTVLMECIDKGHNQSAMLRTCEAYGLLDVHVVHKDKPMEFLPVKGISMGADKWLHIHQHSSTLQAVQQLKAEGFQIIASHLSSQAVPLHTIDLTGKVALVMGSERDGISEEVLQEAHQTYVLPMMGFVESFNVSVATALSLYEVIRQRLEKYGSNGDLSKTECFELLDYYLVRKKSNLKKERNAFYEQKRERARQTKESSLPTSKPAK